MPIAERRSRQAAQPLKLSSYARDVFQGIRPNWTPITAYAGRVVFPRTIASLKAQGLIETHPGGDEGPLWRVTEAGAAEQALYRETFGRG